MRTTLVLLAAILALSSCKKCIDQEEEQPCPTDIICTMDFRSIMITVKENGNPIALDDYKTVRLSDNHVYNLKPTAGSWEDSSRKASGVYTVLTDGQMKQASRNGTMFEFRGYKNGQEVVRERFNINHNCCHINLLSGNTQVNN